MHGGKNQLLPPGDPGRGGRPPTTFRYSQVIRVEDRELYDAVSSLIGKLDEEIALARTNLVRFQRANDESFKGGIPVSVGSAGGSVTVRPYADVVQEYLDLIGKLEERRARIAATAAGRPGDGGGPQEIRWFFGDADEITLEEAVAERRQVDPDE